MSLALYIHWPFCLSKCPYCDFNSHVRTAPDEEKFKNALLQEMGHWRGFSGSRPLSSIFFGGGTPSLMSAQTVASLLNAAQKNWGFAADIEITLEANPTSAEAEKFKGFKAAGVNRVSLGVQALDDAALKSLGRHHSADEALAAVAMAAKIFSRYSFDLIYARKGQTVQDWEKELRRALTFADGHLSLYQLTLEPGTVFAKEAAKGAIFQAPENDAAEMFEITNEIADSAGLPPYEISNYAKQNNACRHNLTYWNYGDYVGIGPGAHGRIALGNTAIGASAVARSAEQDAQKNKAGNLRPSKHATQNLKSPEAWLKSVTEKNHGLENSTALSSPEMKKEAILMGLRLNAGIAKNNWREMFGEDLEGFLSAEKRKVLQENHLIQDDEAHLRATPAGLIKLNALLDYLLN